MTPLEKAIRAGVNAEPSTSFWTPAARRTFTKAALAAALSDDEAVKVIEDAYYEKWLCAREEARDEAKRYLAALWWHVLGEAP